MQIPPSSISGTTSLPYYSQPKTTCNIPNSSRQNNAHVGYVQPSARTVYPAKNLTTPSYGDSLQRHTFDSNSRISKQKTEPSATAKPLPGLTSGRSAAAQVSHNMGNTVLPSKYSAISNMGKHTESTAPGLPKRTIFSQITSVKSVGAPPNYSQNIAEMMEAVKKQQRNEPSMQFETTKSLLDQRSTQMSDIEMAKSNKHIDDRHQDILEKFKAVPTSNMSPIHCTAGDVCAGNTSRKINDPIGKYI